MKLYFTTVFVAMLLSFFTMWLLFGVFNLELSNGSAPFVGFGIAIISLLISTVLVTYISLAILYSGVYKEERRLLKMWFDSEIKKDK